MQQFRRRRWRSLRFLLFNLLLTVLSVTTIANATPKGGHHLTTTTRKNTSSFNIPPSAAGMRHGSTADAVPHLPASTAATAAAAAAATRKLAAYGHALPPVKSPFGWKRPIRGHQRGARKQVVRQPADQANLVNALVNQTAKLVCRPRLHLVHLQQQQQQQPAAHRNLLEEGLRVTWVKDMELLSIGQSSFTSDSRIRPRHLAGSSEWWLEIDSVGPQDEGVYVCQINASPVVVAAELQLRVLEPQLSIEGPEEQVAEGSELRLTCRLSFKPATGNSNGTTGTLEAPNDDASGDADYELAATESVPLPADLVRGVAGFNSGPPSGEWLYIYWYRDNVSLEQSGSGRHRNAVRFSHSLSADAHSLEKTVLVEEASRWDSGEYGCKLMPGELEPALHQVQVGAGATSRAGAPASLASAPLESLPTLGLVLLVALINWGLR